MIKISREKWSDCIDELMPLCEQVHKITEKELYGLTLDFNIQLYINAEKQDQFHCIVMRKNGVVIGFHWIVIYPLMRFKGHKQAGSDAIFVEPEHRAHSLKLIEFSEQYVKEQGCAMWAVATLENEYKGKVWQRKGFEKAETIFMKKV